MSTVTLRKTFWHKGSLTELGIELDDPTNEKIVHALDNAAKIIEETGEPKPAPTPPQSANTHAASAASVCADCGGELKPTSAFGRAPARTGIEAAENRKAKLEDKRNQDVFAGLNVTPRLLDAVCWKPYGDRLNAKFKH